MPRTPGQPRPGGELVDGGIAQGPVEPGNDGFVCGRMVGSRCDLGEGILQNVLGECTIPNTAMQVARECAVIFKQRRKGCTVLGSIHLSIVRAETQKR